MPARFDVVIVGGGNAGLSLAARLARKGVRGIAVVEPQTEHVYAPLQSHIAGGIARRSRMVTRPQAAVTPRGVTWIQGRVTGVSPRESRIRLRSGRSVEYGTLIIAAGIEQRWGAIPGLEDARSTPSVISNYRLDLAEKASTALTELRSGTVVFTQAPEPASCAGVAQKPLYLACDHWRAAGVLDQIRVILLHPDTGVFPIPEVAAELRRNLQQYGVDVRAGAQVGTVRGAKQEIDVDFDGRRETIRYDLLHIAPPQGPAAWIGESRLADDDGFVDVDPGTLRHRRWPNVWALGDAASVTPIRSGGAIRSQAKIVAAGITSPGSEARYDGYSETPFTVTHHSAVFAEFDRAFRLVPSIPFWKTLYKQRRFTFVMDRWILPWVYWNLILAGRA